MLTELEVKDGVLYAVDSQCTTVVPIDAIRRVRTTAFAELPKADRRFIEFTYVHNDVQLIVVHETANAATALEAFTNINKLLKERK